MAKFFSISSDFWRNWGNWRALKKQTRTHLVTPANQKPGRGEDSSDFSSRRPVRLPTPRRQKCAPMQLGRGMGMILAFQVDADLSFLYLGIYTCFFQASQVYVMKVYKHLQKEMYKFYTKKGSNLNSRVENHVASKTIGENRFVSLENWWIFRSLISRHMFCSFAGKNIPHLWKGKIIFRATFQGDMWSFAGGYAVIRMDS